MKTVICHAVIAMIAFNAHARGVSTAWVPVVQDAQHCTYCERLERAGKILKGKHLKEWKVIFARHKMGCPCAQNKSKTMPVKGGKKRSK